MNAPSASSQPPAPTPRPKPARILVVDDCGAILRLAQRTLAPHGHVVLTAADPHEALALYRTEHPHIDLVITDYSMPNLNGLQLVDKLQDLRRDGVFVMITADRPDLSDEELRAAGVRALLLKPFTCAALVSFVDAALA